MIKKIKFDFSSNQIFKTILLNLFIASAYIISGKLGLTFASINPSASAIWPPTGIAFASILILGPRAIPAIFLGAFFVNISTAGTISTSLGIALGNTLEGVVGVYLVKRFANGARCLDNLPDLFRFVFLAGIISTMVSATIGVTSLFLGGLAKASEIEPIWITWWLGDMGGNLLIAPLLIVWLTKTKLNINLGKVFHFLISIIILFFTAEIVFRGIIPYPYLCIPIAVWIAFWFEREGATLATLFVGAVAVSYTLQGLGPFGESKTIADSLLLLQLFLSVLSITSLVFAIAVITIRRSERNLKSSEQRFKALIQKGFDAIVLIDATSKISYASPSVKRIVGYSPEEILGIKGFDLVAPEDRDKTIRLLAQLVLKPGKAITTEYRIVRKDKSIIWVESTGTNLLLEPSVNAVVINFHDITEKKIAEDKLLREKMEDEAMLTSIGEGIVATDSKGAVTILNEVACEALGWKEKDLLGKFFVDAIPMQDENGNVIALNDRPMAKVLSLGKKVSMSVNYYVRKDGTKFPVRFTVTPVFLNKNLVGTIEVFSDITVEKEIDKAKSEFVSLASHQLRTPLTIISWYVEELMRKGNNFNEKQQKYLDRVSSASHRMVELINALLNTSRLELGTFMIEPKDSDLVELSEQVIQDLQPKIKEKNIIFNKNYQNDLPLMPADPKLFSMIIQNLLSNSIKYNREEGKVELYISYDKKGYLIRVVDNGIGIPKNQESKIFSKMFRADNARSTDPDGNGLGLYIVKTIVEMSGGKIWFESEENKGSTFSVLYPISGMKRKEGQKTLT